MKNYTFLKTFFSPFKQPKLKFYLGKIVVGTPHFLPRKWVKFTEQDCINKIKKESEIFERNGWKPSTKQPKDYTNYKKSVPIKWFGINAVGLGWKTKWSDTDYRFEYPPLLSIVFCGFQFCVFIKAPEEFHYWECWLYYENNTSQSLSRRERIEICKEEYPCVWISYKDGKEEKIDYYQKILKRRYNN